MEKSPYIAPGVNNWMPKIYTDDDAMKIAKEVSELYGIDVSLITKKTRMPAIAEPRQMAMVRIYDELKYSQQRTVELFGLIEHSTLIHARKVIAEREEVGQLLYQIKQL